ncbi:MAG: histidinol-phosphatase HisJ family protein [Candidatus Cloacimonetes bacterium]|nr:histidinol-phosphatase HisJ family protein [Candidatus Cloacimonadota bacterium]
MSKVDYHIHSEFSPDSRIKFDELLPYAITKGYTELAITEHLDLSPQEVTIFGIPSLKKYKKTIEHLRTQYPEIKIHCGIEVGDYQSVKDYAEPILKQMQFDLVLGSVHFIKDRVNVAIPIKEKLTPDDVLDYYEENLHLVETCQIDVLAHLGVYKRYYIETPDESHCTKVILKIFEVMIDRGIALEINYSAFRRTYQHLHPEIEQLALYRKLGGKLVTIGSDAHKTEQLGDYCDIAYDALNKFGFEHLTIPKSN